MFRTLCIHLVLCLLYSIAAVPEQICYAEPSPSEVFEAQVLVNLQAEAVISPSAEDVHQWSDDPRWDSLLAKRSQAFSLVLLVEVDDSLLNAAVSKYSHERNLNSKSKDSILKRLRKVYCRENEKAFLFIAKPMALCGYLHQGPFYTRWSKCDRARWRFEVGPLSEKLQLVSFDGKIGRVIRCEEEFDKPMNSDKEYYSSLLFVDSKPIRRDDPLYRIKLSGPSHEVRRYLRKRQSFDLSVQQKPWQDWLSSKKSNSAVFRYETESIGILSMVEEGVPWEDLEKQHLLPRTEWIDSHFKDYGTELLIDIASKVVVGIVLRGL